MHFSASMYVRGQEVVQTEKKRNRLENRDGISMTVTTLVLESDKPSNELNPTSA
jgi:hypothetical protein